ncbi:MAG: hypothetical protein QXF41_00365 [Candidatus Micrarchaeaceae archaeon]
MSSPYSKIRYAVLDVEKSTLIDLPHSARLQYRLLLNDAVIKAKVSYAKSRIEIYYNPDGAANKMPKISLDKIVEILDKEGVKITKRHDEEVDYAEKLYNYAFNPPEIKHPTPYGWEGKRR